MSLDDGLLGRLAEKAGVAARWEDAFGKMHDVVPEDLRAVLSAIGLPAENGGDAEAHLETLDREARALLPRFTGDVGGRLALPVGAGSWRLEAEDGSATTGRSEAHADGSVLPLPATPGYYRLEVDGKQTEVAVAPECCFTLADALAVPGGETGRDPRAWGLAQQLYALRRPGDGGVGDFEALAGFVREAAEHGAAAVSISPVHAQFSADPDRFSPYAPSSRIMLNVLHIAVDADGAGAEAGRLEALDLVDWPGVARDRLQRLRQQFESGGGDPAFDAWRAAEGDKLEAHALFEALHAHVWREQNGSWHWKDWPERFRDPRSSAVAAFADAHRTEIAFHAWLQFRADAGLAAAQAAATAAGMAIGLVSDLAVGTDSGGSHCWSRQGETLGGLTVGAPPDLLQKNGQNWGITAFSPRGLRANGFRAFVEMLGGAMRHAGGVRIDHAMGLTRLWVVPEGRTAAHGAFLKLPEQDLIRLAKLESVRNRAIVLGEDLGTVPEGFPERLQAAGIDGMRVLWFEKDEKRFRPPAGWSRQASGMTSTHDLPTVAGWWKGVDISHRRTLGGTEKDENRELQERQLEREQLWAAMLDSGAAMGPMPAVWDAVPVVDAAVAQVGLSGCELAMIPTEDAVGLEEQPNVPGTTVEHPNWRRRLAEPVGQVLAGEHATLRLRRLEQLRGRPA